MISSAVLLDVPFSTSIDKHSVADVPILKLVSALFVSSKIVILPVVEISPQPRVPPNVVLAPENVIAVVGVDPDLIINYPELCVNDPNVVPSSFNMISAPPASNSISPAESSVIVVPAIVFVPSAVILMFAASAAVSTV